MKKILLILMLLLVGCSMLTRSPAEKSTDPEVIAAVSLAETKKAHARDTSRLVVIGSIALIAGVAIRFASNSFLPKSTGIGVGLATGGAICIVIARFDAAVQKVALPAMIVIMSIVCIWIAWRVYLHIIKKLKKQGV